MNRDQLIVYFTIIIAVAVGWVGHSIYTDLSNEQIPAIPGITRSILSLSSAEIMSPQDHISEDQIKVYDDRVILEIDDPIWSSFTDSNSMDPLLDIGANGIEIKPDSEDDIHIGDVISYHSINGGIVIHRVIEINRDEEGIYYVVKGDNNPITDNEKIRFKDIQGILVAVVY